MIAPLKVNRKLIRANVTVELIREEEDTEPVFDDPADRAQVISDYTAGNYWAWFCAHVKVSWGDFEAEDWLGQCSYASEEDFKNGEYYDDMINTCVGEIADRIEAAINTHGLLEIPDNPCLFCLAATS